MFSAHLAVAENESLQEVAVELDEINIFDDQKNEIQLVDAQEVDLPENEMVEAVEEGIFDEKESIADVDELSSDADEVEGASIEKIDSSQDKLNESAKDDIPEEEVETANSVELNGDTVEYSIDGNKIIAQGNVIVVNKDINLMCDRIEYSRASGMAYATGNVRLIMKQGEASEITGEELTFNFETMEGSFDGARFYAKPYFGYGGKVSKIDDNHMRMENSYITTCDLDKPHYRLTSKKMDIYPGEKLVARSVRMLLGKIPLLYLPRFTQDLRDKEPRVIFTPGFDKDWGLFLLSSWRYHWNENFKGIIHVDAREKRDIAWGIDLDYKIPQYGNGKVRTYYMNERKITSDRFYEERPSPTIERERFGIEWRHKWDVDSKTNVILQYSKQSDSTFLKDYFERRNEEDSVPNTFFLVNRILPKGSISFRADVRVNRFESKVERLPEIRYDLPNYNLLGSGLYLRNTTTYSNLTKKTASPSEVRQNTMRVDTDSQVSYPIKVGPIELNPFVGGRHTYYSKTKDPDEYGSIRGIFKTGASLSTRFYKVYDTKIEKYGLNVNRLRHIITPTVNYAFSSLPTRTSDQLDIFDDVDSLDIAHTMNFAIENKLQTKRNDKTVELLRAVVATDFRLKEHPSKGGFDQISTDIDFRPVDWVTFYFDSNYDTRREHLTTANFDMYINGGGKWSLGIGKRWNREVDDQLTTSFNYKINPKWTFGTYTRFDLRNGLLKEQEYQLTRDLHAWKMDINLNETRNEGTELWMVFTLKAFPDLALDFGTSFNQRQAGSQN